MTGGIKAAGDVMTGAAVARAVEPAHGEHGGHAAACLNCSAVLTGPFCAACGQMAHLHRSLIGLWHDIAHGVFHFEGKVWRTLPLLAWRPGDLMREYIHGARATFVSPLALFLFSVFLMFATFESVGGPIGLDLDRATMTNGVKVHAPAMKADLAKEKARLAGLEADRGKIEKGTISTTDIDSRIASSRGDVQAMTAADAMMNGLSTDGLSTDGLSLPDSINVHTGVTGFDEKIKAALKNPKLLMYKLQSSAYKFAWALIPLSLPFMWLIFAGRRNYKLHDHAIFVTYSLSFVMVLLVAMAVVASLGAPTGWALWLVPVHMFLQLRQAHRLGWFGALWRTATLLIVAFISLSLFAVALVALGLLG